MKPPRRLQRGFLGDNPKHFASETEKLVPYISGMNAGALRHRG